MSSFVQSLGRGITQYFFLTLLVLLLTLLGFFCEALQ